MISDVSLAKITQSFHVFSSQLSAGAGYGKKSETIETSEGNYDDYSMEKGSLFAYRMAQEQV